MPKGPSESGTMNANDIPRYHAEGFVLRRSQTANDPTSASKDTIYKFQPD